ncbi:uncharacterized protein I303_108327 [Kwoniella dejecticola CBS 10117]|uniref:non-specific serine/threonine protein kinase n=1 Tax=Kwoniella dejecticola CBS 10117 TaxID=1296121 RepID=A0A1A5ZXP5_9TREE|nr:AGC protein kinase [Kwoniella dejecticola CBS 10117]OBR82584.1 AGC protein kinase [Kwoniella dejecticola CBS 10117]
MPGPTSDFPLPLSPPYSGDDSPPTIISALVPPNGLSTPDRTPSLSSSFDEDETEMPSYRYTGPSAIMNHNERRQASTSEGSSKGSRRNIPRLEDFQLIKVIGKGCAGRVLLVKHTPTNSVRAMKAISKRSVLTHDELNHTLTEQSILKRFAIEEPHNRFVSRLHATFTDRENFYFVMEFYPGGDLATQMEIHRVLGEMRTRFYAADIVQGLEDLHRHGIIVRDLKPENILINSRGHAVLADFGLSKEFSYRGDPKPIHVVTYPGQPELPPWAGQGAGSLRKLASGQKKLTVDRAYSFVGTSEYLSPEVVRRADCSYAADWWALGCIVFEGLVGRVPFKTDDDNAPTVLYNKILYEPWDELLQDPRMAEYIADPVTYDFIDALLQKDPMWRLTEPCVKQHGYFAQLDWDTVQAGGYVDPYDLDLHPVAEYNTVYFPQLCLEEDPSVDMSSHDVRDSKYGYQRTPLNDNALYALEQAKYRYELEKFAWSRELDGYETVEESEMERSIDDQEEEDEEEEGSLMDGVTESSTMPVTDAERSLHERKISAEGEMYEPTQQRYQDEEDEYITTNISDPVTASADIHGTAATPSTKRQPNLPDIGSPESVYTDEAPRSPVGSPTPSAPAEHVKASTVSAKTREDDAALSTGHGVTAPAKHPIELNPAKEEVAELSTPPILLEKTTQPVQKGLPNAPTSPVSPTLSTHSPKAHPVPIPLRPKPVRQISEEAGINLNLPTGLPSSGLSVSDMVSVPSPHPGSPTRILRRHRQLPSVDTIPIARLSVELHGVRTHIDDEDWEELILDDPNASAPNGHGHGGGLNHSFLGLGRVLKRRPSNLITSSAGTNGDHSSYTTSGSGLRRQIKNSDTSSSRNSQSTSPTKSLTSRPNLFSNKSIENTKKAFGKFKAFPKLRNLAAPASDENKIPTRSPLVGPPLSASASESAAGSPEMREKAEALDRPENPSANNDTALSKDYKLVDANEAGAKEVRPAMGYRRHTESGIGWLGRKTKLSLASAYKDPKHKSKSKSKSTSKSNLRSSSSAASSYNENEKEAPNSSQSQSGPSSPIKRIQAEELETPRSVSNSSTTTSTSTASVSVSRNDEGLPTLQLSEIELSGLDWEPFSGKEWGVK